MYFENNSNDYIALKTNDNANNYIEKDERINDLKKEFIKILKTESAYINLEVQKKLEADKTLDLISSMNFSLLSQLESISERILSTIDSNLKPYINLSILKAKEKIEKNKGILIIYTGGTIGSAPKDQDDPDSPQIVKNWVELKNAIPNLGNLGYPLDAVSFKEPLDSCNVGPKHWRTIAKIIKDNYNNYEGFVILHGTDTMVYTASALSFILIDLGKPVVLTGSQVAGIVNPRNDAHQNVVTSVMLANPKFNNIPVIPEVIVCFGNLISRGNRARKMNVIGYQGFFSPNYPLIGEAGEFITVNKKNIRNIPESDLEIYEKLDTNVILIDVFPGIQNSKVLENILQDKNLKGVILKSYGAGNIPTDEKFLNLFKNFIDNGGIVVNVTSVPEGEVVMGLYETSQVLLDRGIIGGFDITYESALCKLMMLLGNYDDKEIVKSLMQQSISGEQRLNLKTTKFKSKNKLSLDTGLLAEIKKQSLESIQNEENIDKIMFRFKNSKINSGNKENIFINITLDSGIKLSFKKSSSKENILVNNSEIGESIAFDLTSKKEFFVEKISSGPIKTVQKIGFSVSLETSDKDAYFEWEDIEINIYYNTI